MQVERDIPENLKGKIKEMGLLTPTPMVDESTSRVSLGCRVMTDLGPINIIDASDRSLLSSKLSMLSDAYEDKSEFAVLEDEIGLIVSDESPIGKILIGSNLGETKEFLSGDNRQCLVEVGEKIEVSPILLVRNTN